MYVTVHKIDDRWWFNQDVEIGCKPCLHRHLKRARMEPVDGRSAVTDAAPGL